jgi:DNA repair ATPase RecN
LAQGGGEMSSLERWYSLLEMVESFAKEYCHFVQELEQAKADGANLAAASKQLAQEVESLRAELVEDGNQFAITKANIKELIKQRDHRAQEVERLEARDQMHSSLEDKYLGEIYDISRDRDLWKSRAEGAERQVKKLLEVTRKVQAYYHGQIDKTSSALSEMDAMLLHYNYEQEPK